MKLTDEGWIVIYCFGLMMSVFLMVMGLITHDVLMTTAGSVYFVLNYLSLRALKVSDEK